LLAVISLLPLPASPPAAHLFPTKSGDETVQGTLYSYAGHAFENPNNKAGYRADDAADAWKHITDFLANTLKKS
jgi:dienelactone hydrolase